MLDSTPEGTIVVSVVVPGGAAANAGIQEGDVILKVDENDVVPGVSESRSVCGRTLGH
jgi:S1-C subfamily serine protease